MKSGGSLPFGRTPEAETPKESEPVRSLVGPASTSLSTGVPFLTLLAISFDSLKLLQ